MNADEEIMSYSNDPMIAEGEEFKQENNSEKVNEDIQEKARKVIAKMREARLSDKKGPDGKPFRMTTHTPEFMIKSEKDEQALIKKCLGILTPLYN